MIVIDEKKYPNKCSVRRPHDYVFISLDEECPDCGYKRFVLWNNTDIAKCMTCGKILRIEISLKRSSQAVENNWFFG